MGQRQDLQTLLEELTDNVYFQPPPNVVLSYPCIKYERDGSSAQFADNKPYAFAKRYQVTVIDRDPDSNLPDKVEEQAFCQFDRFFAADQLNHWVFTLFF